MKKGTYFIALLQLLCMANVSGQSFSFHSTAPFGIQPAHEDSSRASQRVMFFDADGDGDLDLFHSGVAAVEDFENWEGIHYFIEMQENTGDRYNPQFAPRTEVFNDFPYPQGYFFPAIGDVNRDGHPDFAVFGEVNDIGNRTMLYVQSTSKSEFEVIRGTDFEMKDFVPESFFIPELVDLDADGDLDLLMSGLNPAFAEEDGADIPIYQYGLNRDIRSATPVFQGWYTNPYGLTPNPLAEILTSGDIDNDGDVDLLGSALVIPSDSINKLFVHINTPTKEGKPSFATTLVSPYGLPTTFGENQQFFPTLADLDGDGDLDMFIFELNADGNKLNYYENAQCEVSNSELSQTVCEGDLVVIDGIEYPAPGDYTIITEDDNNCAQNLHLILDAAPVYQIGIEETICEGEVYTVGGQEFSAPGQYEIPLVTVDGCDSLVVLILNVSVIDEGINVADEVLTANQSGASYQWIDCNTGQNIPGATGQSFEVLVTGDYAVIITTGPDCEETSDCIFVTITGIDDQQYFGIVSLYPNPADKMISVRNQTTLPATSVALINVSGQLVHEVPSWDGTSPIDITSLEPGVYFVKLYIGGQAVIRKLIVI